jgi:hypothetical protein
MPKILGSGEGGTRGVTDSEYTVSARGRSKRCTLVMGSIWFYLTFSSYITNLAKLFRKLCWIIMTRTFIGHSMNVIFISPFCNCGVFRHIIYVNVVHS